MAVCFAGAVLRKETGVTLLGILAAREAAIVRASQGWHRGLLGTLARAALLGSLRRRSTAYARHWRRRAAKRRALVACARAYAAAPAVRRSVRRCRHYAFLDWRLGVLERAPLRAAPFGRGAAGQSGAVRV